MRLTELASKGLAQRRTGTLVERAQDLLTAAVMPATPAPLARKR